MGHLININEPRRLLSMSTMREAASPAPADNTAPPPPRRRKWYSAAQSRIYQREKRRRLEAALSSSSSTSTPSLSSNDASQRRESISSASTVVAADQDRGGGWRVELNDANYMHMRPLDNNNNDNNNNDSTNKSTEQFNNNNNNEFTNASANEYESTTNESTNANLSINESTNESPNKSTKQHNNECTNKSTNASTNDFANNSNKDYMNESTNKSNNESTNESINEASTNKDSTNELTNESTYNTNKDSMNESTNECTNTSNNESTNECTNTSNNELTNEFTNESAKQYNNNPNNNSTNESTNKSNEDSTTESTNESTNECYERKRLERIARNEAYLEKLGLGSAIFETTVRTKRKRAAAVARCLPKRKADKERRSARRSSSSHKKKNHSSPLMIHSDHDEEEERGSIQQENEDSTVVPNQDQDYNPADTPRISSRIRSLNKHHKQCRLSEEKKALFKGSMDDNYIGKFKEFLVHHNKISDRNMNIVLQQVSKLAQGEGIRYESPLYGWKEGCYFCKGQKVTLLSDLMSLKEEGKECENRWGRDHSNIWLIQRPLQRLLLFQQFCLNNPDFLTAPCKLRNNYALEKEEKEGSLMNSANTNMNTNNTPIVSSSPLLEMHVMTTRFNSGKSDDPLPLVVTPKKEKEASTDSNNRENHAIFENQRIAKEFDFDGVTYFGTAITYSTTRKLWMVSYDDGDTEELDEEELQTCMLHYQQTNIINAVTAPNTPEKKRNKSSMVTPSPTRKSKRRKLQTDMYLNYQQTNTINDVTAPNTPEKKRNKSSMATPSPTRKSKRR